MVFGTTTFKCDDCGHKFIGPATEWCATACIAPVKCPKCGSMHTYPAGWRNPMTSVFGPGFYPKIWKHYDEITDDQPKKVEPEEPKTEPSLLNKWDEFLFLVQFEITEKQFDGYVRPIVPLTFQDNMLTIQVPSLDFAEYFEEHLIDAIAPALRQVFGKKLGLAYSIKS